MPIPSKQSLTINRFRFYVNSTDSEVVTTCIGAPTQSSIAYKSEAVGNAFGGTCSEGNLISEVNPLIYRLAEIFDAVEITTGDANICRSSRSQITKTWEPFSAASKTSKAQLGHPCDNVAMIPMCLY